MMFLQPEPCYFGSEGRLLFGCYHPPHGAVLRRIGVLLCYPVSAEYMRYHRIFVQMSRRLAAAGYPVFRFDYYGSGDSAGESSEATLDGWLWDIDAATKELRGRCGLIHVGMVGVRLGATLGFLTACRHRYIERMVMWDSVIYGDRYVEELLDLGRPENGSQPNRSSVAFQEVSDASTLRSAVEGINLLALEEPADNIMLLETLERREAHAFHDRLSALGVMSHYCHLPGPAIWAAEPLAVPMPQHVLQSVLSWFSEVPV
jgi:pimeloyl-ACP methyl ester carboxylesterase